LVTINRKQMTKLILKNGHVVNTSFDYPAIPLRNWDWSCVNDNYDGAPDAGRQIIGIGRTEQEAIINYLEQCND